MSSAESAKHQISVWGSRPGRTRDEQLLAALAERLLDHLGDAAMTDEAVLEVVGRAQMEIACGCSPAFLGRLSAKASAEMALTTPIRPNTIYCDGACLNNGRADARAGYGVYFIGGDGTESRISQRVPAGDPQTNQRAELLALQHALRLAAESASETTIYSDSRYALDCVAKWAAGWKARGWVKADKKPIMHLDLIQPMFELWSALRGRVTLEHVAAHTGKTDAASRGNAVADELANAGACL